MEQVEWRQVALREQPYGLDLLPDKECVEYSDPRNEAATEARWAPALERLFTVHSGQFTVTTTPLSTVNCEL